MSNELQKTTNNNYTSTASPPIPSVVDHTKKESSTAVSSNTKTTSKTKSKDADETVTIPKSEFDALNSKVNYLTKLLIQSRSSFSIIQDALALTQSNVVKAKNSIPAAS